MSYQFGVLLRSGRRSRSVLRFSLSLPWFALLVFSIGCSENSPVENSATSGSFSLLTYNVAGLPQTISPSDPERNIPLISPLLNKYDICLIQEDFSYHAELAGAAQHRFQSEPKVRIGLFTESDGLNRFSIFRFGELQRTMWDSCSSESGTDCLARKGFSVAETNMGGAAQIDIYNLHMDAGGQDEDRGAREVQIDQILAEIASRSAGKAVIVAGDFNLNITDREEDVPLFESLRDGAGLSDACETLACGTELVDRVLFRSGDNLRLFVTDWQIDPDFVDENGEKLSDHFAVGVEIGWEVIPFAP